MRSIITIVRKELRAYFFSPVALIFLGVFLAATLFIFFSVAKFFASNLANVRPLFSWLPILLIFLVSTVTMRQWSEEQKLGTLEVLLTLPIRNRDLVIGKFLAGMVLVCLALSLTLPLPITVDRIGDLDWGPVIGGYIGALLLASTYMAIGLCVSARTDNQIVALMVTLLVGGLLYLIGSEAIVNYAGADMAALLQSIGTGSRFTSIERGVLDFRDFAYYASITVFFLVLNVYFLETKRMDGQPGSARSRRLSLLLAVALVGGNTVALNLWGHSVNTARVDLTELGEYTVSETTKTILGQLDEPLKIKCFLSDKTADELKVLIPRIKDFLTEYEIEGDGMVRVDFVDPHQEDDDFRAELVEKYGVESFPYEISGQNERSMVNVYFHIVVEYGDQHKVLNAGDLLEVHKDGDGLKVKFQNLEYDITSSIRYVTQGFQSLESIMARVSGSIKVTGYISKKNLPKELENVPDFANKVMDEIRAKSGGRVVYQTIDPAIDVQLQEKIAREYRFGPSAVDPFSNKRYWLYFLFENGDRVHPVFPQGSMNEANVRTLLESATKRIVPGMVKTIGIVTQVKSDNQPMVPGLPGRKEEERDFRNLEASLSQEFEVRLLKLDGGVVPSDIDVLIVSKPGVLTPRRQFAVDQYLMSGGKVIFLTGSHLVTPTREGLLATMPIDETVFDILKTYGVTIGDSMIMDTQNLPFLRPIRRVKGRSITRKMEQKSYPFFASIRSDGMNPDNLSLKGVKSLAGLWASPVTLPFILDENETPQLDASGLPKIKPMDGLTAEYLAWTSESSWLKFDTNIQEDFEAFPELGFEVPAADDEKAERRRHPIAVSLTGRFMSHFSNRDSPIFGDDIRGTEADKANRKGRTLMESSEDARLVVVGSSELASDGVFALANQPSGGDFRGNLLFIRNLIDWSLGDQDLLEIRDAGAFARTLNPLSKDEKADIRFWNYMFVFIALAIVFVLALTRRKLVQPMNLEETQS